jgi:hypothetical protein
MTLKQFHMLALYCNVMTQLVLGEWNQRGSLCYLSHITTVFISTELFHAPLLELNIYPRL